ncbi:MAG: hypothetical protein KJZ59_11115, partial [Pararhodobacter sp.]|nr:hypothetical protein [Pararhodobacter sp.]
MPRSVALPVRVSATPSANRSVSSGAAGAGSDAARVEGLRRQGVRGGVQFVRDTLGHPRGKGLARDGQRVFGGVEPGTVAQQVDHAFGTLARFTPFPRHHEDQPVPRPGQRDIELAGGVAFILRAARLGEGRLAFRRGEAGQVATTGVVQHIVEVVETVEL